ncbi:FAD dependent oxidoreductase [Aaosphaeria arxii CBS 175.79]|uniref:FAD dependent oxidoreductase n=1 Tax=Aaosphaeria arxii CBS 175.79 TaxID=1450172 RepID=A0A6A5Y4L6_9PLEO|nr:FAD dependent oxidoreductase [Aaosphaeria arxii CBS 175.79]KAF2019454.1 FAD dependent oxidoreductase [Aaosphaeria arxii CBS 175.79]
MTKPSVLIVGGGVFGTSTAYHLSLQGYNEVTVLDRFDVPSKDSAATDLNKVVRADYPNPLYTKLGLEAMEVWKDPNSIFKNMYRESGWIMAAHDMTRKWLESARNVAEAAGRKGVKYMTAQEMKETWPALTGEFPSWTNLWSPAAGWVPSGQAVLRMANAARANGVKYTCGDAGYVRKLIYEGTTCKGVITTDGAKHYADLVLLASGANTATLVEAKEEAEAQCSVICVIKLEPHEVEKYRDIPIIDDFEQGIIFPPDENGFIKLCSCRTLTNYQNKKVPGASILHSLGDYPEDGCPKEIEDEMREFIREMIPELADRPFISTKLCWDALAGDLNFRICPYPERKNLYVATIGSNHGFKFLPVIGKYVVNMLEGKLGAEWQDLWKWKYGKVPADFQDPHPWPQRDLAQLTGWEGRNALGGGKLPWTWSRL